MALCLSSPVKAPPSAGPTKEGGGLFLLGTDAGWMIVFFSSFLTAAVRGGTGVGSTASFPPVETEVARDGGRVAADSVVPTLILRRLFKSLSSTDWTGWTRLRLAVSTVAVVSACQGALVLARGLYVGLGTAVVVDSLRIPGNSSVLRAAAAARRSWYF